MKKRFTLITLCILMLALLAGCGAPKAPQASTQPSESQAPSDSAQTQTPAAGNQTGEKKLIYVFIKNRGDLSFWDSMAEGGDRAVKDFADRADIRVIETTGDLQANLTAMYEAADAGADMIMTASEFKDNLVQVAQEFPDIMMVITGENVVDQADNIYGFDFRTSEAAFLAGIVAADIASQNLEGTAGQKTIGFIGGMDESVVIQEFLLGYIQGAKYADPQTTIVSNYVGGWNDPDTARTQALTQFNDAKADIIFACAGGSGNGVHTAAADAGKYVIGVDSDQSQMYAEDKAIQSRFVTSVLKLGGNVIYNTIERFLDEGTLPVGQYDVTGVKGQAVGIVQNELFDSYVSDEGKQLLKKAEQDIIDGKVEIIGALDKEQDEIKSLIEELSK